MTGPAYPVAALYAGWAAGLFLAGGCLLLWSRFRFAQPLPPAASVLQLWPILLATSAPALLTLVAGRFTSASWTVLCWAFLPACVEFFAALRPLSPGLDPGRLLVALLAAGGLLLIVPFAAPASPRAWAGLLLTFAAVVLCAAAATPAAHQVRQGSAPTTLAAACLLNAGACALAAPLAYLLAPTERIYPLSLLVLTGTTLASLLSLTLLRQLSPTRWATRPLLLPIVGLAEANLFGGEPLNLRLLAGAFFTLAGTLLLWRPRNPPYQPNMSLR